ncbi:hypothetical protein GGI10_001844 [Coemansia sp. RSA 2530]|nr:hypothetical protein GGI10_001844 [Coemansia sp. RSA 2530]
MSEEPPRHSPSPAEQYVEPPSDEQHAAEEQPPSPPADEQPSPDQNGDEPVDSYPAAGAPTSVDLTDAMTKARAIAAKLGSMQRPAPAALTLGDDAYESRTGEEERYRRRRSASPERDGGYKRGRGESRGRRFDVEPAFGEGAPMEFMVPAALVGLIIGRAGSNLRGIEQQHGVRIQMNADYDKRDPERKMTIEGPPQASEAAKRDILDFIDRQQQAPPRSSGYAEPQEGGMTTILVPSSKVGLIIGRGGENIRDIQFSSGARVQVQPDSGRGGLERPIQLIGAPEQIEVARARIMEIVSSERGAGGPPGPRGGQEYGMGGSYGAPPRGYGGPPVDRGMPQQGAHVEEMQVPAEAVGIIIGRGGETIKQLQQASGARIQIIQGSDRNAPFKPVTISGDHGACMRARRMIEEKVDSAQPRGGYDQRGYDQRGYDQRGGYDRQPQRGSGYGAQQAGGYGGGYAEASDPAMEQKAWSQQPQQPYYGGAQPAAQYGAAYQQGYQTQVAEQPQQWTNQMTADHYAQYAATNPEYAQYAEYYRKLAEKDPDGIVPSGN